MKFETAKVDQCLDFIEAKGLHKQWGGNGAKMRVKATGGGAYKYADVSGGIGQWGGTGRRGEGREGGFKGLQRGMGPRWLWWKPFLQPATVAVAASGARMAQL